MQEEKVTVRMTKDQLDLLKELVSKKRDELNQAVPFKEFRKSFEKLQDKIDELDIVLSSQVQTHSLYEVLLNVFNTLIIANKHGLINDTIFLNGNKTETLFDYISTSLGIKEPDDYIKYMEEKADIIKNTIEYIKYIEEKQI